MPNDVAPAPRQVGAAPLAAAAPTLRAPSIVAAGAFPAPVFLVAWLAVAAVITLAAHATALGRAFDHPHAWVSAHFATMARAFVEHGVFGLGGVPVQNNDPLGAQPDVYLHWPPLFSMLLAGVFHLFGATEANALWLMLCILATTAAVLYRLVARTASTTAALVAVLVFLAMPVTVLYGRLVVHLHLAILGMLIAVLAFVEATRGPEVARGWAIGGMAALFAAVWASWEPVFVCPALLAAALRRRRAGEIRLAVAYAAVAATAVATVGGLYAAQAPDLIAELWQTVRYRMGLASYTPPRFDPHVLFQLDDYARQPSRLDFPWLVAARLELVGQIPALALGAVLISAWVRRGQNGREFIAVLALLAPWVSWFVVMFNHAWLHEYEMALAAPALAVATGLAGGALVEIAARLDRSATRRTLEAVLIVALPAVLVLPMIPAARQAGSQAATRALVDYGREIAAATAPGAVVLAPSSSMVPVYYAERHVIRGVRTDALVTRVVAETSTRFPSAPVFLALLPEERAAFPDAARRWPVARESPHLVLFALDTKTQRDDARADLP